MFYVIKYRDFSFNSDVSTMVWYYPIVDSLPVFLCCEMLRPLLRSVPADPYMESVLTRVFESLQKAAASHGDAKDNDSDIAEVTPKLLGYIDVCSPQGTQQELKMVQRQRSLEVQRRVAETGTPAAHSDPQEDKVTQSSSHTRASRDCNCC